MLFPRKAPILAAAVLLWNLMSAMAAEEVGEAVLIKTEVTGASGPLVVKDPFIATSGFERPSRALDNSCSATAPSLPWDGARR